MKAVTAAFLLLCLPSGHTAILPPSEQWASMPFPGSYDFGALASANDGGAFLMYSTQDDETIASLVRLDWHGNIVWQKCLQDHWSSAMEFCALIATSDGGALAALTVGTREAFDPSCSLSRTNPVIGLKDCWLLRLNADGSKRWDKTFGGSSYEDVISLRQTLDGGFLLLADSTSGVSGNKTATNFGGADIWLVRLDAEGNKLWDRAYGSPAADGSLAFDLMPDGGCVVLASRGLQPWVLRVDAEGNKLWDNTYPVSDPRSIRLVDNGQLLLSCATAIVRLATDGQVIAVHNITAPGTDLSRVITPDGGVIGVVPGNTLQATLVRYNETNLIWSRPFTNYQFFRLGTPTRAGGFLYSYGAVIAQMAPDAITARPEVTAVRSVSNGTNRYDLTLHGVSNHTYAVDHSLNLANWLPFTSNLLNSNSLLIPVIVTNPATFFRARVIP